MKQVHCEQCTQVMMQFYLECEVWRRSAEADPEQQMDGKHRHFGYDGNR